MRDPCYCNHHYHFCVPASVRPCVRARMRRCMRACVRTCMHAWRGRRSSCLTWRIRVPPQSPDSNELCTTHKHTRLVLPPLLEYSSSGKSTSLPVSLSSLAGTAPSPARGQALSLCFVYFKKCAPSLVLHLLYSNLKVSHLLSRISYYSDILSM